MQLAMSLAGVIGVVAMWAAAAPQIAGHALATPHLLAASPRESTNAAARPARRDGDCAIDRYDWGRGYTEAGYYSIPYLDIPAPFAVEDGFIKSTDPDPKVAESIANGNSGIDDPCFQACLATP